MDTHNHPVRLTPTADPVAEIRDSCTSRQESHLTMPAPAPADNTWTSFPMDLAFPAPGPEFQLDFTAVDADLHGDFSEISTEDLFSTNALQTWAYGV